MHARVPSSKSMQQIAAAKKAGGSTDNLKKLGRNASATNVNMRKNGSHVSLKRNQSSGDVSSRERAKSKERAARQEEKRASAEVERRKKEAGTVHFEMGDDEEEDVSGATEEDDGEGEAEGEGENDGWEEASSSASPALSRSASRPNSAKVSANNSEPQSPLAQTFKSAPSIQPGGSRSGVTIQGHGGTVEEKRPVAQTPHTAADAKIITERLLQRVPSHQTTKMSLATAHPSQSKPTLSSRTSQQQQQQPSDSSNQTPNSNGTSQYGSKEEVISRFVSGSGTPHDQSYLSARTSSSTSPSKQSLPKNAATSDNVKRAQSMGNLSKRRNNEDDDEDYAESDRPLAPKTRSRKSSTGNAYTPPHTSSRTQQKLMLQRASSNIEPQNLAHPPLSLSMANLGLGYAGGIGINGLGGNGVGHDGRNPRIKAQLDRTGLEYLVVRRHQDPIGLAIKRLEKLPGHGKSRKIPTTGAASSANSVKSKNSDGRKTPALSGSLTSRDGRKSMDSTRGGEGSGSGKVGSYNSAGEGTGGRDRDGDGSGSGSGSGGVTSILRSLWEKNFDFGGSAD